MNFPFLGGGNSNIFMFIPKFEEDEPILTSIFQDGLVQPPTSFDVQDAAEKATLSARQRVFFFSGGIPWTLKPRG